MRTLSIYTLVLTLTSLMLVSCEKDQLDPQDFTGVYNSTNILYLDKPVMYTTTGQVTDSNIIKAYIDRIATVVGVSAQNYFSFSPSIAVNEPISITLNEGEGTFNQNILWGAGPIGPTLNVKLSSLSTSEYMMEIKDTLQEVINTPSTPCEIFVLQWSRYLPNRVECSLFSSQQYCKSIFTIPLKIESSNQIDLPFQRTLVSRNSSGNYYCVNYRLNFNLVQAGSVQTSADTVVVQQGYFRLIR